VDRLLEGTAMAAVTVGEHAAEGCIDEAARFLAAEPDAVRRALATHRPRPDGSCRACGEAAIRWPCVVAVCAQRAAELIAAPPTLIRRQQGTAQ
jgi:hypothetical protein